MTTPTKYIEAPKEVKERIMAEHNIPISTMDSALRFARSGDRSKEIRALVLATGEATVMNYLPQCETIHDAEGKMIQTFLNGLVLIIDKRSGYYRVYEEDRQMEGEELLKGKVHLFPDLYRVQYIVETYREEQSWSGTQAYGASL